MRAMALRFRTPVILLAMAACSAAAVTIAGAWALGVSAVILLLLAMHVLTGQRGSSRWGWVAVLLGLLGGLVATASATAALMTERSVADTGARAGFGWTALALAVMVTLSATRARARPHFAAVGLVAGSCLGITAMSLSDVNTFYVAALPLCWIAAALALLDRHTTGAGA